MLIQYFIHIQLKPKKLVYLNVQAYMLMWVCVSVCVCVCVCCRSFLQRVLSAYVESVSGVAGAEDPEWSGDKLWEDRAWPASFRG